LQCRFVIYKKGLEREVDIKNAKENLTTETFVAYNPLAKVPFLVLPDGTVLPESEVRSAPASPHVSGVTRGGNGYGGSGGRLQEASLLASALATKHAPRSGAAPALRHI